LIIGYAACAEKEGKSGEKYRERGKGKNGIDVMNEGERTVRAFKAIGAVRAHARLAAPANDCAKYESVE